MPRQAWDKHRENSKKCRFPSDIHPLPAPPEGREEEEDDDDAQVRKLSFHFTSLHKNDNFTKTGSGQAHLKVGETHQETTPFLQGVEAWSVDTVAAWVQTVLPELSTAADISKKFVEEEITGSELLSLSEVHLKGMGVSKIGHRLKLLNATKQLKKG